MRLAALVSGGKDSIYAIDLAIKEGHSVTCIIAIKSQNPESYMFHVPNIDLVRLQAEGMNIPYVEKESAGEKEKELADIESILESRDIDGVLTGAVKSNYQKERIDKICNKLGLESVAPLWHTDEKNYLERLVAEGYDVRIVSVAAPPLDENWLGRKIDNNFISEISELNKKFGISLVGEGGEFDTFVADSPLFSSKVVIKDAEKIWDSGTKSGVLNIKKVVVERKTGINYE